MNLARSRLQIVDYFRFAAALMVVAYHYLFAGIANGKVDSISHSGAVVIAKYGYLGVDFFFLVSGFVIAASATGKTARQFAVGRAQRLYPAFWVGMLLTAAVAAFLGDDEMSVTATQVLANLTMMPEYFGQGPVDGVYWTLMLELKFYALVFVLVLLRQAPRLSVYMSIWALAMAALTFVAPDTADGGTFTGGYYLLFAAGAIISAVRTEGWNPLKAVSLISAYVAVIPAELRRAAKIESDWAPGLSQAFVLILVTVFFGLLMLTLNRQVSELQLPAARTVGALTYPVYLLHAHIGYMVLDRFANDETKWSYYAALLFVVLAFSYFINEVVEVSGRKYWKLLFESTLGSAVQLLNSASGRIRKPVRRTPAA
ncbi:acyltransferase family protein [Paenarthrobacter nitroguajacolicus]|uniref:acyltransferase family protein n=1 Tax=Paenarthrobacter nitroguajacolicus TaxID=211146 RepID=UPI003AD88751